MRDETSGKHWTTCTMFIRRDFVFRGRRGFCQNDGAKQKKRISLGFALTRSFDDIGTSVTGPLDMTAN